jgi:uncharacterized protein (DUF1697 family)
MRYVALLRGINVGGHIQIRMDALRRVFESLGFRDVRTLLNSGNVLFEADDDIQMEGERRIEEGIEAEFGFHAEVLLRTQASIRALVEDDPFKELMATPATRFYVTFRRGTEAGEPDGTLSNSYQPPEGDIRVLRVTNEEICTCLVLSPQRGTVDLMKLLQTEFGRSITTRSWNTVRRIAAL